MNLVGGRQVQCNQLKLSTATLLSSSFPACFAMAWPATENMHHDHSQARDYQIEILRARNAIVLD